MKKLQVVVATMNQCDFAKVSEMNIHSDVIFANQANGHKKEYKEFDGFVAEMITTPTRGVGMNRNIGLENATGDILLIADDDMRYISDYKDIVLEAFEQVPDADALIFNISTIGKDMGRRENIKIQRVYIWNALNYGAVRIAVKRERIKDLGIGFNLNFGGGTIYSAGEDTLLIADMLKKKMKIYTYPVTIASVDQTESTWFSGYNRKYFYDKGALFAALSPKLAFLLCLQDILRHKSEYTELSGREMIKESVNGIAGYKKLLPYCDIER